MNHKLPHDGEEMPKEFLTPDEFYACILEFVRATNFKSVQLTRDLCTLKAMLSQAGLKKWRGWEYLEMAKNNTEKFSPELAKITRRYFELP